MNFEHSQPKIIKKRKKKHTEKGRYSLFPLCREIRSKMIFYGKHVLEFNLIFHILLAFLVWLDFILFVLYF